MNDKNINDREGARGELFDYRPYTESPFIGKLFKKHGIYDGKLFFSPDKVTYTFLRDEELISLHFDKKKRTLFFKGHNMAHMSLDPQQLHDLEQFHQELAKNPKTKNFAPAFEQVL